MKPKKDNIKDQSQSKQIYQPPKKIEFKHKKTMTGIGNKLKKLRQSKDVPAYRLAKEVGISRNAYHQMECGEVYFSTYKFMKVLDYHDISVSEFFVDI